MVKCYSLLSKGSGIELNFYTAIRLITELKYSDVSFLLLIFVMDNQMKVIKL